MTDKALSVLVVDDEATLRESILTVLRDEGYAAEGASSVAEAIRQVDSRSWDMVISDLRLPDGDGIGILSHIRSVSPESLVLIITAFASIDTAISALRLGAVDYLVKPLEFDDLLIKLQRLADYRSLRRENAGLRRALSLRVPDTGFVGESAEAEEVRRQIGLYGPTGRIVLLTGPSGTGKEVVARALHAASEHAAGPFVPVNCAAIPESLLESELFGHRRGAFTGADRNHQGFLALASEGTLLLDEIAEMPLELQPKLLRVLENREVYPVGSSRPVPVRTRIVAATNRDLETCVREGRFREDLYYRLNVLQIQVPPLKERRDDIPVLAQHFIEKYRADFDSPARGLSREAAMLLRRYDWPGNVRELENQVQQALVVEHEEWLSPNAFFGGGGVSQTLPREVLNLKEAVREFERDFIQERLERLNQDKRATAESLGISLASLYAKLKESAPSEVV